MGVPRRVRQIATATEGESPGQLYAALFALADDGSVWRWRAEGGWFQVSALPDAEACGERIRGGETPCQLRRRHDETQHWNGVKRWG